MLKLTRFILSPFTLLYGLVVKLRNFLFDKEIFKAKEVPAKVISIGNLTVGGSGKTPTTDLVTEILSKNQIRAGVLSRGYKRKSKGYRLVCDGENIFTSVEEAGDEIMMIAMEKKIPAAVAERRVEGAIKFLNDVNIDVIVLDDGFQHRWIKRDLDILVIDQRFLQKVNQREQYLLPFGDMREPFSSIERADIILINRKFNSSEPIPPKFQKYFNGKKVFFAEYKPVGFYDVKNNQHFPIKEFEGQKSLVVCGIARPYSFLSILENNSIDIGNKLLFKDHKDYNLKEVQLIRKKFYDTNSHSVLTTEKDAIKLTNFAIELDDIDIYYLKIKMFVKNADEFEKSILEIINKS